MQNPTDPAEASIPTETVRESPNLNRTFTVRRKAAKRSERWYQITATPLPPSPQGGDIPARKKPRLDEPIPTATDEVAKKILHLKVRKVFFLLPLILMMQMQIM
jgi:hypothetical protein